MVITTNETRRTCKKVRHAQNQISRKSHQALTKFCHLSKRPLYPAIDTPSGPCEADSLLQRSSPVEEEWGEGRKNTTDQSAGLSNQDRYAIVPLRAARSVAPPDPTFVCCCLQAVSGATWCPLPVLRNLLFYDNRIAGFENPRMLERGTMVHVVLAAPVRFPQSTIECYCLVLTRQASSPPQPHLPWSPLLAGN